MNLSLYYIFAVLGPVVYIPAFIPLFTGIIMWVVSYVKYDIGVLMEARLYFESLAGTGEGIEGCGRENILLLDEAADTDSVHLRKAWDGMRRQLDLGFEGDFIPEGRFFFDFDLLVLADEHRENVNMMWRVFLVLGFFSVLLPFGIAFIAAPMAIALALYLGFGIFLLLCFCFLLFTLLDKRARVRAFNAFLNFISMFDRILPVAKGDVALFSDAAARNREASDALAVSVSDQLDRIVDGSIIPMLCDFVEAVLKNNLTPAVLGIGEALDAGLSKTLEVQEKGMEKMTDDFSRLLGQAVKVRVDELAVSVNEVKESVSGLNDNLRDHVRLLSETTLQNLKAQQVEMKNIGASFTDTLTNTLETQMIAMSMTVGDLGGQLENLGHSLRNNTENLMETVEASLVLQRDQAEKSIALQDERNIFLVEQQSKQMEAVASSFSDALSTTLGEGISGLNGELSRVQGLMGEMGASLSDNLVRLSAMLDEQHEVLNQSSKMLIDSKDYQMTAIEETRHIQEKYLENNDALVMHMQNMSGVVDDFTKQTDVFTKDAFRFIAETNETQEKLSVGIRLSQDKLEAAVNETISQYSKMNDMLSSMMDQITGRMNEAMINAGKEIAYGIKEVTADNAEAIGDLAKEAEKLRSDYATLFSGIEGVTEKVIDDMDYEIKTIIQRMSEDIGSMLKENTNANAAILEGYKDNTVDLLQSFDEQARSIGLYAKEINLDITELTESLKESVAEFTDHIKEGVKFTLSEFDSGLAELTYRMANTVEGISDAVEALPEVLNQR